MAVINRYDTPAESNIINTYTPIPFDEIAKAGMARQQRYDQAALLEDQAPELIGGPSLEAIQLAGVPGTLAVGDRARVEALNQELTRRLDNLSQAAGTMDKGDAAYQRELRRLYRDISREKSPTGVYGRAAANVATAQELQKRIAENPDLQKSPWLANQLNRQIQQFAEASQAGLTDFQANAPIGEYVDITKETDQAIDGINSILIDSIDNIQESTMYQGYLQTGKFTGIPENKIRNAVRSYLNTVANPVTRDLESRREYMKNYTNLSDDQIDEAIRNEKKQLENFLVYKYTENDQDYNIKTDSGYNLATQSLDAYTPLIAQNSIFTDSREDTLNGFLDKLTFSNGQLNRDVVTGEQGSPLTRAILASSGVVDYGAAMGRQSSDTELAYQLLDEYGFRKELNGLSEEQKLTKIVDFLKHSQVTSDLRYFPHSQAQGPMKEFIINNLATANFDVVGKDSHSSNIAGRNSVAEALGYAPDELKQVLKGDDAKFGIDFNVGKFVLEVPDKTKRKGKAGHKYLLFDLDEDAKAAIQTASTVNRYYNDPKTYTKVPEGLTDLSTIKSLNPTFTPMGTENGVPVYVYVAGSRDITKPNQNTKTLYKYNPVTGESIPTTLRDYNNAYTKSTTLNYAKEGIKYIKTNEDIRGN